MNNKDEIDNADNDDVAANQGIRGVENTEVIMLTGEHATKDLHLRYILPIALSAFLLILLLLGFGKAPEILVDFGSTLKLVPNWYVLSPENANQNINIEKNYPADFPRIASFPKIDGYNLLGSTTFELTIVDRVDDIIYSLIYVNQTDKRKRVVLHLLSGKGEVANELAIYSAKRMTESCRIHRIDETLITTFQIDGKPMVLVQPGTNLDDAVKLFNNISQNNR